MFIVASFYKFAPVADPLAVQAALRDTCERAGVMGTILVAAEGLNGSIAGARDGVDAVLAAIRALDGFADLSPRETQASKPPFYRLKVRLKKEIVTMGAPTDPATLVGTYVDAADWNALISDPDVAVIDTRNDYEVRIGTFDGAIDPQIKSFGEFPGWWEAFARGRETPKVAMFCTGGIRCEKATSHLKALGVPEVYHLKGGILSYLDAVPPEDSLWRGECFVFDQRAALGHGLEEGSHALCHACREPVSAEDMASPQYEPGVNCPRCFGHHNAERVASLRERQKQIGLAKARGERHIGGRAPSPDADADPVRPPARVDHG
jgi:UPF0176 protein